MKSNEIVVFVLNEIEQTRMKCNIDVLLLDSMWFVSNR